MAVSVLVYTIEEDDRVHLKVDGVPINLAEFDFRYNRRIALGFNDTDRATEAVKGAAGKRLTYRQAD